MNKQLLPLGTLFAIISSLLMTCVQQPAVQATQPAAQEAYLFGSFRAAQPAAQEVYLFASFRGNGQDGLHLAWNEDGLNWTALNNDRSFLKPLVGKEKLMRDPCIARGPDGTFHMVWTDGWSGHTIGYASSKDLITWSEQRAIPVMSHEPTARNCWAPEIVYDEAKKHFLIFWSTTIPDKFPETNNSAESNYNHRIYATTTTDFQTFTPTKLFYDGGFNVIDASILRAKDKFYLFVKDETSFPVTKKHLRIASGPTLEGPWTNLSPPFTPSWVEGPTAFQMGEDIIMYYDKYRIGRYGAMRSKDLETWEDISDKISVPRGTRHGTIFKVPRDVLTKLQAVTPLPTASGGTVNTGA